MKRRREVLIEIEREIVISTRQRHHLWCPDCGRHVQMLNADEAARAMNTSESVVYDEVDRGRLHATATAEGSLLVCADSVLGRRTEAEMPRLARLLIGDGCEPVRQPN